MEQTHMLLTDKVAIITGGGKGIGRSIALEYAKEGADIVICGRTLERPMNVSDEIKALGRRALALVTDIRKKDEVDRLIEQTIQEFGKIDILVNNASWNVLRPIHDLREDGWDKIIDTNLKGYFLCSQAAGTVMMNQRSGKIINLTSGAGVKASAGMGAYSVAKAGVIMLTQVLAKEWAPFNINVNAIGPGLVKTDFSKPLWSNPDVEKKVAAGIPLGRIPEPEEIVGTAVFLASDASSFITGQTIFVDGGSLA
ncbi:MAG: 3-oxoacyl-ACP reductase family protein [Thermodesulfobacteriota bacterium]|nr:3-oxoacyl-ACP reductase family protein [Thermodesulfobacteriota bacterium]